MEEKLLIRNLRDPATREAAFTWMMRQWQQSLYWHIRKMVMDHDDADDVLQTTFIKAWKALDQFREESRIRTWLYRIATHETFTFLEKKKKRALTDIEDLEDDLRYSSDTTPLPAADDLQARLEYAVSTLPERQRAVFQMKYYEEMQYAEIAEVMGVTEGALKASFHHAVKKIEKIITAG